MDLSIESAVVTLKPGQALRVRGEAGLRISHVQGRVWVTLDGEKRDVVLQNGADLVLGTGGGAVLQAVGAPALVAFEQGVMSIATPVAPQARAFPVRAAAAVRDAWRSLAGGLQSARTRCELKGLSDYQLRDIGLRRSEIDCLVQ